MERRSNWSYLLWISIFFFGGSFFIFAGSCVNLARDNMLAATPAQPSVMVMDLKGIILDSKKFLKRLRQFREKDEIKAFVIRVNSPGGVVGPSQELNDEIRRTREEFKKPVVVYSENLNASGAYYASVAADKIVVAPGSLIGSIGVIMEFANLRDLYKWAKIERYSIKSGDFKDIGSEYRPMREDERAYLQSLINQVLQQFKTAILNGRPISAQELDQIADGKVFTGEQAKALKLVDEVGSYQLAIDHAGEASGLGTKPKVFELPKERPDFLQFLISSNEHDEAETLIGQFFKNFSMMKFSGQMLMVYPGGVTSGILGGLGEEGH